MLSVLVYWFVVLPQPLFHVPFSVVLEDRDGELLGAKIAADGQWRFPPPDSLPERYVISLTTFEDKRFFYHPGIDPMALVRAVRQNIAQKRVVSGGSTLTMQVIRMARGRQRRTISNKMAEAFMATRLELTYSKQEILKLYAAHAPFGGNVVGLDAAAWRYFGKRPAALSWAEAATLAVLPNSPSLIHPGRNRAALMEKRNRLLQKLHQNGSLDKSALLLAQEEPLPDAPHPLPAAAPHLLERLAKNRGGSPSLSRKKTSIREGLQRQVNDILKRRQSMLAGNGIHNLAAVVIDVPSGSVLAYVGNVVGAGKDKGEQVDIITAPRSSGSILKPLLYAMMLQDGLLLPDGLVPDVPMNLQDFQPENFNRQYEGVVPAHRALSRSLNVPFVYLLKEYGVEKFHFGLNKLKFSTFKKSPAHYGLSLILGGAETNLWEVVNTYASMARTLNHFGQYSGRYDPDDFRASGMELVQRLDSSKPNLVKDAPFLSASAIWFTFEAMRNLERPEGEGQWERFGSGQPVAWKTGTSFGFRDAWAVGVTPRYAVGVWAGNADGEGRPGLVGVTAAAPVLFDIFQLLRTDVWFSPPYDDMIRLPVCSKSGYRPLPHCPKDSVWLPRSGLEAPACSYHQMIVTDKSGMFQLHADCASPGEMYPQSRFVLSPLQAYFYLQKHADYTPLPPLRVDCNAGTDDQPMEWIYPRKSTRMIVPVNLDGNSSRTIFSIAHRQPQTKVYWHLDNQFLGATSNYHQMALAPSPGMHRLVLVDQHGRRLELDFEIVAN